MDILERVNSAKPKPATSAKANAPIATSTATVSPPRSTGRKRGSTSAIVVQKPGVDVAPRSPPRRQPDWA